MTKRTKNVFFTGHLAAAMLVVGVLAQVTPLLACTTPVYRYATYRWMREPYGLFYLYDKKIPEDVKKFHEELDELSRTDPEWTNLEVIEVDVSKDTELRSLPPNIRKEWKEKSPPTPTYLLISPMWGWVYQGDISKDDIPGLIASPKNKELIKAMDGKTTGVLVLLTSKDKTATDKAEKEAKKLVDAINSGKLRLGEEAYLPEPKEGEKVPPPSHTFKFMKIDRFDDQEKWFVKTLLAIEPDLPTLKHPMLFPVYGRGRALPPYVGRGITYDNLIDVGFWLTGPCSCTVKDQNPGVDLLTRHDWEKVSETMADHFGAEEGNEQDIGDLFPQLIVPQEKKDESEKPEKDTSEEQPKESSNQ
jgi:hypothetical protein